MINKLFTLSEGRKATIRSKQWDFDYINCFRATVRKTFFIPGVGKGGMVSGYSTQEQITVPGLLS